MTLDIGSWLADTGALDGGHRAALAWRRIMDKPTNITIRRGATTLTAQTVRLEFAEGVNEPQAASGPAAVRQVTVLGIRSHPTLADTNIRRGDRFVLSGNEYQVVDVVRTLGEIQAHAEVVS